MNTDKKHCTTCGWWDIGMKYGAQPRCTQCGSKLNVAGSTAAQRPVKMLHVLGK